MKILEILAWSAGIVCCAAVIYAGIVAPPDEQELKDRALDAVNRNR